MSSDSVSTNETRERRPARIFVLAAVVLLVIVVLAVGFVATQGVDAALELATDCWALVQTAPAPVYFGVMAFALLLPAPATVFYIAAGPLYGIVPSLLWIAPALALNALLVHAISSSVLRPRLELIVAGRGMRIPRLRTVGDQNLFIALIRITPGIPYFIQSWVLGLADVERARFVVITVAVQMVYATGFVALGRSAFEGEFGMAGGALALIVFASICARIAHKRLRAASDDTDAIRETAPPD